MYKFFKNISISRYFTLKAPSHIRKFIFLVFYSIFFLSKWYGINVPIKFDLDEQYFIIFYFILLLLFYSTSTYYIFIKKIIFFKSIALFIYFIANYWFSWLLFIYKFLFYSTSTILKKFKFLRFFKINCFSDVISNNFIFKIILSIVNWFFYYFIIFFNYIFNFKYDIKYFILKPKHWDIFYKFFIAFILLIFFLFIIFSSYTIYNYKSLCNLIEHYINSYRGNTDSEISLIFKNSFSDPLKRIADNSDYSILRECSLFLTLTLKKVVILLASFLIRFPLFYSSNFIFNFICGLFQFFSVLYYKFLLFLRIISIDYFNENTISKKVYKSSFNTSILNNFRVIVSFIFYWFELLLIILLFLSFFFKLFSISIIFYNHFNCVGFFSFSLYYIKLFFFFTKILSVLIIIPILSIFKGILLRFFIPLLFNSVIKTFMCILILPLTVLYIYIGFTINTNIFISGILIFYYEFLGIILLILYIINILIELKPFEIKSHFPDLYNTICSLLILVSIFLNLCLFSSYSCLNIYEYYNFIFDSVLKYPDLIFNNPTFKRSDNAILLKDIYAFWFYSKIVIILSFSVNWLFLLLGIQQPPIFTERSGMVALYLFIFIIGLCFLIKPSAIFCVFPKVLTFNTSSSFVFILYFFFFRFFLGIFLIFYSTYKFFKFIFIFYLFNDK